jgi:hypothetical protein
MCVYILLGHIRILKEYALKMKLTLSKSYPHMKTIALLNKTTCCNFHYVFLFEILNKTWNQTQDNYKRFPKLKIISLFLHTGLLNFHLCRTIIPLSNCLKNKSIRHVCLFKPLELNSGYVDR